MTKSSLGRAGDGGMFCYLLSRTGLCFTGRGHHRPWAGEAVSRAGSATVSLGALDQSQACLGLSFSVHRRGDAGDQQARVDGSCPAQGPRGPRPDGGVLTAEGGPGHSRAGRATRGAGWRQRPEGEWLCVQAAPPAHQVRAAQQRARNKTWHGRQPPGLLCCLAVCRLSTKSKGSFTDLGWPSAGLPLPRAFH